MKFVSTGLPAGSRPARSTDAADASASAGFTLLETLTALAILAVALVSLFEAHTAGLRTAGAAADYARARLLGEALLADTVTGWHGGLASKRGRDGPLNWTIDVAQVQAPWANIKSKRNWRLHRVRVTVAWDKGRRIELDTLKLGRAHE